MFLGRESELESLRRLLENPIASLVAFWTKFPGKAKVRKIRPPGRISVRKGLIYDGELSPSVKRGGYFDAIIDLSSLIA